MSHNNIEPDPWTWQPERHRKLSDVAHAFQQFLQSPHSALATLSVETVQRATQVYEHGVFEETRHREGGLEIYTKIMTTKKEYFEQRARGERTGKNTHKQQTKRPWQEQEISMTKWYAECADDDDTANTAWSMLRVIATSIRCTFCKSWDVAKITHSHINMDGESVTLCANCASSICNACASGGIAEPEGYIDVCS